MGKGIGGVKRGSMRGLYFVEGITIDRGDNGDGIEKKVLFQINELKKISTVDIVAISSEQSLLDKIKFLFPIIESNRERERRILLAKGKGLDYIYIRKPSLTIKFYKLLRKLKKENKKLFIIMELPTYPFHREYRGISRLMAIKSIPCEKKLKNVVDYIVTYSNDEKIWGIQTIKISNCVEYSKIEKREMSSTKLKTIRLTSVANFNYWHGLDRLITGIYEYCGSYKIILNVVGEGREIPNLKKLTSKLGLEDSVIFHGFKSGNELKKVFDNTDIAVDSLGRHRSGVSYNSSLKGKEYAARGVPSISGVLTEFDYIKEFPYYLKVPSDDTPININQVIDFYEAVYCDGKSVSEVTEYIREYSFNYFDYSKGYRSILNLIESKCKN